MEPINVLFLHKWFSLSGGVERVHKNLSRALDEQGIRSAFYVNDTLGDKRQGFEKLSEGFQALSPDQTKGFRGKLKHLFAHVEQSQVSVIISATETANMLALCCTFKFPKLKVIYTRHCAFDVSDQKLPAWMIKLLYNLYALSNNTIVTVSESLKNDLKKVVKVGKSRIQFIPNAVVNKNIRQLAQTNSDKFGHSNYFCAVGRLVRQKGFDLLLHAYAISREQNSFLPKLVIVGTGEDLNSLQALVEQLGLVEHVVFTGYTENPYYIIKQAEAFVLSSRHEGMPTVLVEAMYLDTPVIAFDCPTGPGELIKNNENGVLVPHLDIKALANAISNYRLLQARKISSSVSQFQYENVAQQYMSYF